ncbi:MULTISPECIES: hypothetical protein [unclassified Kribbella]|uniref:hypothetical protein n=1 Tax=unclassified Kribbella TaxID=2644121 RepID=UPI003018984D
MSTVAYLLLVLLAALISSQLLILMDRGVPVRKRFRDLSEGGDAWFLLAVVLLLGSTVGAFAGNFLDAPGQGATVGLISAGAAWITGVVRFR